MFSFNRLAKPLAFVLAASFVSLPAYAWDEPPLLADSPCGWFIKTAPDVWTSNRIIRADAWGLARGLLSFAPGTYKIDDGTDAFEFVERKCGRGATPRAVYRAAMPLPLGLLPWYQ